LKFVFIWLLILLPKNYRLPSHLIPQVLRKGKRFSSDNFTLVIKKVSGQSSRFAFIVPIKFDKRAVCRNRLKRQMREAVRTSLEKIKPGYNITLLVKKPACRGKELQTNDELITLLRQARLFKSK
jgi:ribonuclease P protein component